MNTSPFRTIGHDFADAIGILYDFDEFDAASKRRAVAIGSDGLCARPRERALNLRVAKRRWVANYVSQGRWFKSARHHHSLVIDLQAGAAARLEVSAEIGATSVKYLQLIARRPYVSPKRVMRFLYD